MPLLLLGGFLVVSLFVGGMFGLVLHHLRAAREPASLRFFSSCVLVLFAFLLLVCFVFCVCFFVLSGSISISFSTCRHPSVSCGYCVVHSICVATRKAYRVYRIRTKCVRRSR